MVATTSPAAMAPIAHTCFILMVLFIFIGIRLFSYPWCGSEIRLYSGRRKSVEDFAEWNKISFRCRESRQRLVAEVNQHRVVLPLRPATEGSEAAVLWPTLLVGPQAANCSTKISPQRRSAQCR